MKPRQSTHIIARNSLTGDGYPAEPVYPAAPVNGEHDENDDILSHQIYSGHDDDDQDVGGAASGGTCKNKTL